MSFNQLPRLIQSRLSKDTNLLQTSNRNLQPQLLIHLTHRSLFKRLPRLRLTTGQHKTTGAALTHRQNFHLIINKNNSRNTNNRHTPSLYPSPHYNRTAGPAPGELKPGRGVLNPQKKRTLEA